MTCAGGRAPPRRRGSEGSRSGATASITCSAWPSITAITAWTRSSVSRSASLVTIEIRSPRRSARPIRRSSSMLGTRSLRGLLDPHLGAAQQLAHEPGDVAVQPRDAGELDRVGDLVQRHPGHELAARRRRRPAPPGRGSAARTAAAAGGPRRPRRAARARTGRAPAGRGSRARPRPRRSASGPSRAGSPASAARGPCRRARARGRAARASSRCCSPPTRGGRSPRASGSGVAGSRPV